LEATGDCNRDKKFPRLGRILPLLHQMILYTCIVDDQILRNYGLFKWNERYEKSFQELKKRLMTAPILSLPEEDKPYALYTDASKEGLGAVFIQD
jgi:hypothetical protein